MGQTGTQLAGGRLACRGGTGAIVCAVAAHDAVEGGDGALQRIGCPEEAGLIVQGQDQRMDLEAHLVGVGVGAQMAFFDRDVDRALHGRQPGADRTSERIAHRARPVLELDRAADVDAARVDFDRGALHPVVEHRAQSRQAARRRHGRVEHLFLEGGGGTRATTEICSSSREPKWANTPDLLICMTSASAPIDRPSRPICVASPRAASTMAALVCWPFCRDRVSEASLRLRLGSGVALMRWDG